MYSLALLGFSSFLLALFLTPVVRNLSWRWGLVDEPGEERRVHTSAVPRVGGVAIFVAYLGAFGILLLSDLAASRFVLEASPVVERLFPAAALCRCFQKKPRPADFILAGRGRCPKPGTGAYASASPVLSPLS